MPLHDWSKPYDWDFELDNNDTAPLPTGVTAPCVKINRGAMSNYRLFGSRYGSINGGRANGIFHGTLEAWIKAGSVTTGTWGLFFRKGGAFYYRVHVEYGSGQTNRFKLTKTVDGGPNPDTETAVASFDFGTRFTKLGDNVWRKLKVSWWEYTPTKLAIGIEFDDNTGQGLRSVNPDSHIAYIDSEPNTVTTTCHLGIYQKGTDADRRLDNLRCTAFSTVPDDTTAPTLEIVGFENHDNWPELPSGGIHILIDVDDDYGYKTLDWNLPDVQVQIDGGAWLNLSDGGMGIGELADGFAFLEAQTVVLGLSPGAHTVKARAKDSSGNVGESASTPFTVT